MEDIYVLFLFFSVFEQDEDVLIKKSRFYFMARLGHRRIFFCSLLHILGNNFEGSIFVVELSTRCCLVPVNSYFELVVDNMAQF